MTNPYFSDISQYRDVESLNIYQEKIRSGVDKEKILAILASKSRDNSRTPMQWDSSKNAGFSKSTPWIDVAPNYRQINVACALKNNNSIYYCYRDLIALRKTHLIFTFGDYTDLAPDEQSLWSYLRRWEGEILLVVANFSAKTISWHLPSRLANYDWQMLYANSSHNDKIASEITTLNPYEAYYFYAAS